MPLSHDDALDRLLASSTPDDPGHGEAAAHVARCPSCWAVVRACHHVEAGTDPVEAERMTTLFGCERVRDELYLLAADPAAAPPHLARHVGWCGECRGRFLELLAFTRAEEGWRDAVARLVVRVGDGLAAFAALAAEMRVLATVAAPVPVRGPATGDGWAGEPARVAVTTGAGADATSVAVAADGDGRVRLTIVPSDAVTSIALRAVGPAGGRLVASQSVEGDAAVVFRQVPVGAYRVTLAPSGAVLALDVVPAAGP